MPVAGLADSLKVTGVPAFSQALRNEAAARCLSVEGYQPTAAEQARIDQEPVRNDK